MSRKRFPHLVAALQALLVTFLWSTSFVLVKVGLKEIPPSTFAGLRYVLAFLCLLPFALRSAHLKALRTLSARGWQRLVVLGLLFYTVTQGTTFFGLGYLPSATVSLLLNFTTIIVALSGIFLLAERPVVLQWMGVLVNIGGVVVYFWPVAFPASQLVPLVVVVVGMFANAGSSILGRHINREGHTPPLVVTTVSMGAGAVMLLVTGILTEPLPHLTPTHWAIIGWLAVVNTAFAFTLWNHTLRTLSAMESSIINNTMLVQVAALSWLFLGESLTGREIIGMVLAGLGALIVQLRSPATPALGDAGVERHRDDDGERVRAGGRPDAAGTGGRAV